MAALRGVSLRMVSEIKMKVDPFHPESATVRYVQLQVNHLY